jgi:hypothetical protein
VISVFSCASGKAKDGLSEGLKAVSNGKTVAALKLSGRQEMPTLSELITKLWKSVIVTYPLDHARLNVLDLCPLSSTDGNIKYLETIVKLFHDMSGGKKPTGSASPPKHTPQTHLKHT